MTEEAPQQPQQESLEPVERGRFISIEGGEGVGKSTQIKLLADAIRAQGHEVVTTREPGGTENAEALRKMLLEGDVNKWDPVCEVLLINAARRDHVLNVIVPALEEGKWVICDRYADSTMAYQGYARKLGREFIETIDFAVMGEFGPDLTLILDLPFDEAMRRIRQRRETTDRMEMVYEKIHKVVRGAFLDIAGRNPDRCHLINAAGSQEDVSQRVKFATGTRLGLNLT